ncbi:hypothetical protein INS49_005971 [Diaporthe citri]|uniref:uncharacterized protein n=1 Tax=Diaporthe citri TaxID=83186 RepID=UPI001C80FCF0|nr:uncharacterized protein INS49_005971 [Diaporthe citri]KAG6364370.1 hypothetical protein INS49_005971 [Diaporthe citri]
MAVSAITLSPNTEGLSGGEAPIPVFTLHGSWDPNKPWSSMEPGDLAPDARLCLNLRRINYLAKTKRRDDKLNSHRLNVQYVAMACCDFIMIRAEHGDDPRRKKLDCRYQPRNNQIKPRSSAILAC